MKLLTIDVVITKFPYKPHSKHKYFFLIFSYNSVLNCLCSYQYGSIRGIATSALNYLPICIHKQCFISYTDICHYSRKCTNLVEELLHLHTSIIDLLIVISFQGISWLMLICFFYFN